MQVFSLIRKIKIVRPLMIDDEVPIIVERNCLHFEEVESDIHSISSNLPIPILFENCDDTKDSNSVNIKTHLEKVDITSNPISDISDSIDFTIVLVLLVTGNMKEQIQKVLIIIRALSSMKIPWIHRGLVLVKLF